MTLTISSCTFFFPDSQAHYAAFAGSVRTSGYLSK